MVRIRLGGVSRAAGCRARPARLALYSQDRWPSERARLDRGGM